MTTRFTIALLVVIVSFLAARFGLIFGQPRNVTTPHTTEIAERYVSPITREVNTEVRVMYAHRADGSTATSRTWQDKVMSRTVTDFLGRRKAVISDADRTKSTIYFSEQEQRAIASHAHAADCSPNPKERPSREDLVMGTRAFVFESHDRAGQFQLKSTRWLAPALGCIEIQGIAEKFDKDGVVTARTEKAPVYIRPGEPESALFRIPDEYEEMSPSAMQSNSLRKQRQAAAPDSLRTRWIMQDERYYASQRHKP